MPAPLIPSAFETWRDTFGTQGSRPVVFDILAPDKETSLLPDDLKLVLHINPRSMRLQYQKAVTRTQTRGGFVEYHWGDALQDINFEAATGGFVRLYSGVSNKTGSIEDGATGSQGRRETIAYDRFLDLLALWHGNAAIYDVNGDIALHGYIKIMFDEGVYIGKWDGDCSINETAEIPYQFSVTGRFIVQEEILVLRSTVLNSLTDQITPATGRPMADQPVFGELGVDPETGEIGIRRGSGITS